MALVDGAAMKRLLREVEPLVLRAVHQVSRVDDLPVEQQGRGTCKEEQKQLREAPNLAINHGPARGAEAEIRSNIPTMM